MSLSTALIDALCRQRAFPFPADQVRVVETHLSWVLLAGEHAYKIKKALDVGFADFRSLSARLAYCQEEVRLNRRTAAHWYLGVAAITGTPDEPRMLAPDADVAPDRVLDYAVVMRRFADDARLDQRLRDADLSDADLVNVADDVAAFHQRCPAAAPDSPWGSAAMVAAPARQNIEQILPLLSRPTDRAIVRAHQRWLEAALTRLEPSFERRRAGGFVREVHGDLHLGNLARIDGRILLFDCLEFDAALRWIDVISEIAFLTMDLDAHGARDAGIVVLNRYLERTGDYDGLDLLRFYLCYRAMVRAKVEALRMSQGGADEGALDRYLGLISRYAAESRPAVIVMHGPSGSGKSVVAEALARVTGAIRLRSDVERKRLAGLPELARSDSAPGQGLYTDEINDRTYDRLLKLAATVIGDGFPVIVDATCLRRWQRELFRALARERDVPFAIVDAEAPLPTLRARVIARARAGSDPSEADERVLERQLATREPLARDESRDRVRWDATQPIAAAKDRLRWSALLRPMGIDTI